MNNYNKYTAPKIQGRRDDAYLEALTNIANEMARANCLKEIELGLRPKSDMPSRLESGVFNK